ncbi:MAG: DUF1214 domain-containing protein [Pseudomonadota bacterium]
MKYLIILLGAFAVVGAMSCLSRSITMDELTNQRSIFDTFDRVDGTWLYSDKIGVAASSAIQRARVAIGGPLGLSAQEAVYFVATKDANGETLRSQCTYRLTGQPIDTRWWSLTLYDSATQHYVPNEVNRSSWNSVSVPRSASGEWVINIAPTEQASTWLPTQEEPDKSFELMLRVYNPSEATRMLLPNIDLPIVERLSC